MRAFALPGFATQLFLLTWLPVGPSAGILYDQKGLGWASFRDITSQEFSDRFDEYSDKGYNLVDMDGYASGNSTRYSMIWHENKEGIGWSSHRGLT